MSGLTTGASGSSENNELVCPLLWRSPAQLAIIDSLMRKTLQNWATEWHVLVPDDVKSKCLLAHEAGIGIDANWRKIGNGQEQVLWLNLPEDYISLLQASMFEEAIPLRGRKASDDSLAKEMALLALDDFIAALSSVFSVANSVLPSQAPMQAVTNPWSGVIAYETIWCGGRLRLVFAADCVSRLLPAQVARENSKQLAKLVPIESAVSAKPLHLTAELDHCELDVGSLQQLQVGDIVRLSHAIEDPLHVKMADGTQLCVAYLGRNGGNNALELMRNPAI